MAKVLVTDTEIKKEVEKLYQENKKIVFTNGCFDLLHPGHIAVLEKAKGLGDVLFLGLNTDESVKKLKGSGRPILPLKARIRVLSAIKYVDYIVPFAEDTPLRIIKLIKPHVLVKGGDYKPEEVVGREVLEEYGGKVVIVPYIEGYSTTGIIEKIKTIICS